MNAEKHKRFLAELKALLRKYGATITADDHWEGYAECGEDVRMTVEFIDGGDLDLGDLIDGIGQKL